MTVQKEITTHEHPELQDFATTAMGFIEWLQEHHVEMHVTDKLEQQLVREGLQKLANQSPTRIHYFRTVEDGELMQTPDNSLQQNHVMGRIWHGELSDVWSVGLKFSNYNDTVHLNAILAPSEADMTNFLFPPQAFEDDTYVFCRMRTGKMNIEHILRNGSTETDFLQLLEQKFVSDSHSYSLWLSVDFGPEFVHEKYLSHENSHA